MGFLLFAFFVVLPIAEVVVLAKVASRIGFWDTVFLLIFSGLFGTYLAKIQGKAALIRIQTCLAEGRMPTHEMMDGLLLFLGGLLFVFPGFISDFLGFLLIFPLTRWLVRGWVLYSLRGSFQVREARKKTDEPKSFEEPSARRDNVQDAEIVE